MLLGAFFGDKGRNIRIEWLKNKKAVFSIAVERILVAGDDRRLAYACAPLSLRGYSVALCGSSHTDMAELFPSGALEDELARCDALVLPPPLKGPELPVRMSSPCAPTVARLLSALRRGCCVFGGYMSQGVVDAAQSLGLRAFDYSDVPGFAERNAVPTAEGALKLIIEHSEGTVMHAKIAVTGYGRTGRAVCEALKSLDADVTAAARSELARSIALSRGIGAVHIDSLADTAGEYDAVVNTVPYTVLDARFLSGLRRGCPIIELASAPGGVDLEAAGELGLRVINAPALPAAVAPRTAGELVAESILKIIEEEGL